ncbi:nucleoside recognition domain-containing protein [Intestinimonas butyriciproducens]|uniref:nucleoside recognition domain-containing protein n=1 Tax=Intestinimonas butyriciproducens TaxID=1297617 RepID=UPI00195634D1|nr:nucleoside recognition domain-containing protein [Intestinimonas butyriciproducens]MBM6975852.1 sporulation protein [Intestinimonas butyriciproducens]
MSKLLSRQGVRDLCLGLGLLCATLALMFWPQEAMEAAREGLRLCYNVILPSLFPFFVLSALVVDLGLAGYIGRALEGLMRPLFRVPGACASAFVLGFVGGYPVGARTALSLYQKGMCTKTEAERLLAFCNNSGPAFILGVVGAGVFASSRVGVLLYLAHAAASVCVGLLFRFYRGEEGRREGRAAPTFQAERFTTAFTGAIKNSFLSTLNICAFVVFFTVVIKLLFLSGVLPGLAGVLGTLFSPLGFSTRWAERLLTGLIELTSGVWTLTGAGTMSGRLSMAAFLLGWAGLSVHCQVLSFLGGSGLSVKTYIGGKLLHGGLSALFTSALLRVFPLSEPVSAYLAEQVEGIAGVDFSSALTISLAAAWGMWLLFFLAAAAAVGKTSRKRRKGVI